MTPSEHPSAYPFPFASREPIQKGWSNDTKYKVTGQDGTSYLLRISPPERYEAKRRSFTLMEQAAALGVPMCAPIAFGRCEEGVYSLQGWIDGVDAEELMPALPPPDQYAYGLEAGRILRRLHAIPAPAELEDWEVRFNRKIDRKLEMYGQCPLKYEGGGAFLRYIEENRHLLKGRPQVYQHGDFHIGNMMIDRAGRLHIIDFDRDDFGDPWEEFNRIIWCAQCSPPFASGMVDGYFKGPVPMEFWRLLALYIASNTLSSLPWAVPYGQEQIDVMLRQGAEILAWYKDMTDPVPTWYQKP